MRRTKESYWNKDINAHLRPQGWCGPYHFAGFPRVAETGNISIDHKHATDHDLIKITNKVSLVYTMGDKDGIYTQIESKDTEDEPDLLDPQIWIRNTGATTQSTMHDNATCNCRNTSAVYNVYRVTGPPLKSQDHC